MSPAEQREKLRQEGWEAGIRAMQRYVPGGAEPTSERLLQMLIDQGPPAADAIPDAPVCPTCKGEHPDVCSDGVHAPIPDAPSFETLVARVGDLPTTGLASAESTPVPSRAELIELMARAWYRDTNGATMGDVLDALIKAGAVRG